MLDFDTLISRADEELLQELLGREALRLIQLLNRPDGPSIKLKDVLVDLYSKEGLLTIRDKRSLLLELLKRDEALDLCSQLGISPNGDIYTALTSLKLRRCSNKEAILFKFFKLDPPIFSEPIQEHQSSSLVHGSYPLFKHQRNASSEIRHKLLKGSRRVLLHMPTGSGKTRTTMHFIANHLIHKENTVVVWLAYSEELCAQAAEEFSTAWTHLGNREVQLNRFWGSYEIDLDKVTDGILIAGLSKMYSMLCKNSSLIRNIASRCSLIVIDEAHQAIADTYKLVLDSLFHLNMDTALVGLTATPGRTSDNIDKDLELSNYFNRQKVTLKVDGYDNPIDYLVKEGYLAKTNYSSIEYRADIPLTDDEIRDLKNSLDIPEKYLKKLAADEVRNLQIINSIMDMSKRHDRIIVFAASVDHSYLLSAVLRARGFSSEVVSSRTPPNERKRIILDFKDFDTNSKILCNYGVLTTGFDAPKTSAAIVARPTKSLVLYSQMVGRATRGILAGGNKNAEILTVVDLELPGFKSMVDSFNNWDDVWSKEDL